MLSNSVLRARNIPLNFQKYIITHYLHKPKCIIVPLWLGWKATNKAKLYESSYLFTVSTMSLLPHTIHAHIIQSVHAFNTYGTLHISIKKHGGRKTIRTKKRGRYQEMQKWITFSQIGWKLSFPRPNWPLTITLCRDTTCGPLKCQIFGRKLSKQFGNLKPNDVNIVVLSIDFLV